MFEAWASSPHDGQPSAAMQPLTQALAAEPSAPPSLRRVASGQGGSLTRQASNFVGSFLNESPFAAQPSGAADLATDGGFAVPPPRPTTVPQALAAGMTMGPPSVGASRQISENPMPSLGRSVSSFVRDFIDESASLVSAPPASAVPPSLQPGPSFSDLMDLPGIGSAGGNPLPSLSDPLGPPALSRRASPRIGSPRH